MSINDQQEAFEKLLGSNLARVFDLVRFAETKNAALLTFASAWILAMLNLLSSDRTLPPGFAPAFLAALPLFALAAFACVISFLPKIDISRRDPAARPTTGSTRTCCSSWTSRPCRCRPMRRRRGRATGRIRATPRARPISATWRARSR